MIDSLFAERIVSRYRRRSRRRRRKENGFCKAEAVGFHRFLTADWSAGSFGRWRNFAGKGSRGFFKLLSSFRHQIVTFHRFFRVNVRLVVLESVDVAEFLGAIGLRAFDQHRGGRLHRRTCSASGAIPFADIG